MKFGRRLSALAIAVSLVGSGLLSLVTPTAEAATQSSYRWRNDDGTEAAATWAAAPNAAMTNFNVNAVKRLRFGVAGDSGDAAQFSLVTSQALGTSSAECVNIDSQGGYAYVGFGTAAPIVMKKIRLSDLQVLATATLASATTSIFCAFDVAAGYGYLGSNTDTKLVRFNLSNLSESGTLTMPAGNAGVITVDGGYLYSANFSATGTTVTKVRLSDFTVVGTKAVTEMKYAYSIKPDGNGHIYLGNAGWFASDSNYLVRMNEGDLSYTLSAALPTVGVTNPAVADLAVPGNGYIYVAYGSSPGRVLRVREDTMAVIDQISLTGSGVTEKVAVDTARGYLYVPDGNRYVNRIRISDFSYVDRLLVSFNPPDCSLDASSGFLYCVTFNDGKINRISIAPHRDLRLEAAPKVTSCAAATGWQQVTASSSPFRLAPSSYVADQTLTTQQLGSSPFVPGRAVTGATLSTGPLGLAAGTVSEVEYSLTPTSAAPPGASYCFRVTDAGAPLATYSAVAEAKVATVSANAATQTSVVGDAAPSIDAVIPSDASGSGSVALPAAGFTLNEGAPRTLYVRGTVSDANGCTDLTGVAITVYRSSVSGGATCTPDNNDCYTATVARSTLSGCSGAGDSDATFEVSVPVANYADPTDAGSPHDADTWKASATVTDAAGATGTLAADFEIQSLAALSVAPATMDYGTINLGATSTQQTLTFTNVGNRAINSLVRADGPMRSNLAGFADIPTGAARFSVGQAVAWTNGSVLSTTDGDLPLALPQQAADAGPAPTAPAYFYLKLPATGIRGTYTNTLFFTAYAR